MNGKKRVAALLTEACYDLSEVAKCNFHTVSFSILSIQLIPTVKSKLYCIAVSNEHCITFPL